MRVIHVINSLTTGGAEKLILDSIPFYNQRGVKTDVLCLLEEKTTFWQKLEERGFKIEGLTQGSVYNPLLIFKIIPYLKKYNVIHAHLFPVLYWVVLAKWLSFSKTKIIYTEHNTNNRRRKLLLFKMIDRIIYRGVFRVVTIADEVDQNIKQHLGFKEEKFQLIHNGIDFNLYNTDLFPEKKFFSVA